MSAITQEELLNLFTNSGTSVRTTDQFHIHTSTGQLRKVSAEVVRAYLLRGILDVSITADGYIILNGIQTEYKVEGGSGAIPEGLEDRIIALEEANNPTSLTINISPSVLQKKGSSTTVTLTWSLSKKDGTHVSCDSSQVNGSAATSPITFSNVTTNTTYQVKAVVGDNSYTASKTIVFVSPTYIGFASAPSATESLLSQLNEQPLSTSLGTITKNNYYNASSDNYLWICSPYQVTKVTSDGFGADMTSAKTITVNGTTYYCYRSSSKQASGSFNLQIS